MEEKDSCYHVAVMLRESLEDWISVPTGFTWMLRLAVEDIPAKIFETVG